MIDMASVYAERYKKQPQTLQAAVMGQSPDPKLDPYTALNALRLVKESQRMAIAGQAQMQKDIDTKYQDYLSAQNYPYKQLSFMSDIIRGVPLTQTGSSVYQAAPSTMQNITSLGLGAAGISKLFADGGEVKSGGGLGALALNNLV